MKPFKINSLSPAVRFGCFLIFVGTACSGWAADKNYCVQVNYTAVPSLVNYRKITLIVNVGTCASVAVTADGAAVTGATYSSSAGTATFTTTGSNIVVTAKSWTAGGTGAATKATLYNNFHWAYSLTFDDNRLSQYDYGKPVLDSFGWRAAEAVVGSWANGGGASGSGSYFMNWTCLQNLRAAGWDMLDHSYDHPNPLTCNGSATDIDPELANNEPLLLKYFPGYNVTQMVFPYEVSTANTCAGYPASYLLSAECGGGSYNYVDVALPFQVQRGGLFGTDDTAWKSLAASSAAQTRPTWLVQYTHSVSQGSGAAADTYSTNQTTLTDLLTYLNNTFGVPGSNNMWFAPAGEVRDYIFTRDNAVVTTCTAVTPTFTPTNTVTNTATATPTNTVTSSPTKTPTNTVTNTPTNSTTKTPTNTATNTFTNTPTKTITNTPTNSATNTLTNTGTTPPTNTATNTPTNTDTNSPTKTTTNTPTATPTNTLSPTGTSTPTGTMTNTVTNTNTATNTPTNSSTSTMTNTPTQTATNTVTNTLTKTSSPINTPTKTTTNTPTNTLTNTSTSTVTNTPTSTPTKTFTNTPTSSPTNTTTSTPTNSPTSTHTNTPTNTATDSPTATTTFTKTNTPTATSTFTPTSTTTHTNTPTITPTYTPTITEKIVIAEPFPNPSSGSSITFNIQVPDEASVTLDVFTLGFRKIYGETTHAFGPVNLEWNLRDISGALAANGLYYVRIHVSGAESTTKIFKVLILR